MQTSMKSTLMNTNFYRAHKPCLIKCDKKKRLINKKHLITSDYQSFHYSVFNPIKEVRIRKTTFIGSYTAHFSHQDSLNNKKNLLQLYCSYNWQNTVHSHSSNLHGKKITMRMSVSHILYCNYGPIKFISI